MKAELLPLAGVLALAGWLLRLFLPRGRRVAPRAIVVGPTDLLLRLLNPGALSRRLVPATGEA